MTTEEIKEALPMQQLLAYYCARPGRSKGQYHCIVHDDRNPSLLATEGNGRANCMSPGCAIKNYDIFDIIALVEKVNFAKAKIKALEIIGYSIPFRNEGSVDNSHIPETIELQDVHIRWLKKRFGDGWEWIVKHFNIRGWKNHHVAVPIDEEANSMVFIPLDNTKDQLFYKGKTRSVQLFPNKKEIQKDAKCILVCEGEKDVMRATWELHQKGILGNWAVITNTNGANSIKENTPLFFNFNKDIVEWVLVAYDNDEAGQQANTAVFRNAQAYFGENVRISIFDKFPLNAPVGYDMTDYFNDMIQKEYVSTIEPVEPVQESKALIITPESISKDDGISKGKQKAIDRVIKSSMDIYTNEVEDVDFLHTVLCQVGMPRSKTDARIFERKNGKASLILEAGKLYLPNKGWVEQPLPYGIIPRLIMVYITGEALRTNSPVIEVGGTLTEFMRTLGIENHGGKKGRYGNIKSQISALSAARLTLGMEYENMAITINTQPIKTFTAWLNNDGAQTVMWPGVIELSHDFFDNLKDYAVPLDHRALQSLKHSALCLDIYTWLANRLPRINTIQGLQLSWDNLFEQFGQEYKDIRSFRKEFKEALAQTILVYKGIKIETVLDGKGNVQGYVFQHSPPVVPRKTSVFVAE